ncbi:MAG: hypothetical protein Kow0059_15870 [Candidatus Sumerlaeia bacterium]
MRLGCSYFGNRILRHVKTDLEFLRDNGFTYVVHTFSENDQAFYKDQMAEIVALTRELGLEAHVDPWGVGRVFGGEAFSAFTSFYPECQQIASDGRPTGGACPNNPRFVEFMTRWTDDALAIGADVVFWDEPHFYLPSWQGGRPGTWGCRCAHCREKFLERFGEPMPEVETDRVVEFKKQCTVEFLVAQMRRVKQGGRRNSLCLFPTKHDAENIRHWEQYVAMPELDNFGSDPYWAGAGHSPREFVGKYSRGVLDLCREYGKDHHIWIQGFKIPAGAEEDVRAAIHTAVEAGVEDLAVWGFDACRHISSIRCGDSDRVWAIVCEEFRRLQNRQPVRTGRAGEAAKR